MSGARWVQDELLERRPGAGLRVYAIYFEMVEGDRGAKSRVDPKDLLDDPRVVSYWDDSRIAGRWFDENVTRLGRRQGDSGRIEWDAFILYGADARWEEGGRPPILSWGRPVFTERERLDRDLDFALSRSSAALDAGNRAGPFREPQEFPAR